MYFSKFAFLGSKAPLILKASNVWSTSYCFLTGKPFRALLISVFTVSTAFTFLSVLRPRTGAGSARRLAEVTGEPPREEAFSFLPPVIIVKPARCDS